MLSLTTQGVQLEGGGYERCCLGTAVVRIRMPGGVGGRGAGRFLSYPIPWGNALGRINHGIAAS